MNVTTNGGFTVIGVGTKAGIGWAALSVRGVQGPARATYAEAQRDGRGMVSAAKFAALAVMAYNDQVRDMSPWAISARAVAARSKGAV